MNPSSDGTRGTVPLRLAAVIAILALAGLATGAMFDSAPSGDEVLDRVADRYDTADSYTSTVAVTVSYENESGTVERSGRARLLYSSPDRYRVEAVAPERLNGTVVATNGTVAWATRPAGTTIVRSLNDTQEQWLSRVNLSAALDRFQERATVTRRTTTTIDGTQTYVLDVRPTNESYDANATIWVDTDDYDVQQIRTVGTHNGTTVTATTRYDSLSFGVSIHESAFRPPTDRSVVLAGLDRTRYESLAGAAANVSFDLRAPSPPAGFSQRSVLVTEQGERQTVTVTYENGSDRIAVVQSERNPLARIDVDTESVTVAGVDASYLRRSGTGVVFWRADGLTYGVAGQVDRERLVTVAESLTESE